MSVTKTVSQCRGIRLFSVKRIFLHFSLLFFLLMIVIPTTYQMVRGFFLALLCLGSFIGVFRGWWSLSREIVIILLMTTSAALAFMLNGLIHDAPGALRVGTVYVVWPLLYVYFAGFFHNPETVVKFERVIIWGVIISALMGLLLVAEAVFAQGRGIASIFSFQGSGIGIYDGYTEYRLFNMNTLIYGFPFLTILLMLKGKSNKLSSFLSWSAFILTLFAAVISGRRAFWLIIVLSPFIISLLLLVSGQRQALRRFIKLCIPAIILCGATSFTTVLDTGRIVEQFVSAFDFSGEPSAGVRYEQFQVLISKWMERPVFGYGAGAAAEGFTRSGKMTWAYELSYVAQLFHTGIVGICIYTAAVLWVFVSGISIVRKMPQAAPVLLPLLAALAGFLIVNATNPYLGKFDYLWTLFLPVAAINSYRTGRLASTSSSSIGTREINSASV